MSPQALYATKSVKTWLLSTNNAVYSGQKPRWFKVQVPLRQHDIAFMWCIVQHNLTQPETSHRRGQISPPAAESDASCLCEEFECVPVSPQPPTSTPTLWCCVRSPFPYILYTYSMTASAVPHWAWTHRGQTDWGRALKTNKKSSFWM